VKAGSISLARARELAQLVKRDSKGRAKGARKKAARGSDRIAVSQSFYERYLGHFGVGSAATRTARSSRSRTTRRPARQKKAAIR
jgi:hypothetical protein